MRTSADALTVLVEAPGFASVEIDAEIQHTAVHHARGVQVPVSKGGERVRVRLALPDGGRVLTTYNTKVTATVCGKLVCLRPDGTEIVATDNGCVEMRPPTLWEGEAAHLPNPGANAHSSEPEPDKICGAYIFNCQKGVVEVEDPEFNRFEVHVADARAGEVDIDLAGVTDGIKAEAVVNADGPRMFVVGRGGDATRCWPGSGEYLASRGGARRGRRRGRDALRRRPRGPRRRSTFHTKVTARPAVLRQRTAGARRRRAPGRGGAPSCCRGEVLGSQRPGAPAVAQRPGARAPHDHRVGAALSEGASSSTSRSPRATGQARGARRDRPVRGGDPRAQELIDAGPRSSASSRRRTAAAARKRDKAKSAAKKTRSGRRGGSSAASAPRRRHSAAGTPGMSGAATTGVRLLRLGGEQEEMDAEYRRRSSRSAWLPRRRARCRGPRRPTTRRRRARAAARARSTAAPRRRRSRPRAAPGAHARAHRAIAKADVARLLIELRAPGEVGGDDTCAREFRELPAPRAELARQDGSREDPSVIAEYADRAWRDALAGSPDKRGTLTPARAAPSPGRARRGSKPCRRARARGGGPKGERGGGRAASISGRHPCAERCQPGPDIKTRGPCPRGAPTARDLERAAASAAGTPRARRALSCSSETASSRGAPSAARACSAAAAAARRPPPPCAGRRCPEAELPLDRLGQRVASSEKRGPHEPRRVRRDVRRLERRRRVEVQRDVRRAAQARRRRGRGAAGAGRAAARRRQRLNVVLVRAARHDAARAPAAAVGDVLGRRAEHRAGSARSPRPCRRARLDVLGARRRRAPGRASAGCAPSPRSAAVRPRSRARDERVAVRARTGARRGAGVTGPGAGPSAERRTRARPRGPPRRDGPARRDGRARRRRLRPREPRRRARRAASRGPAASTAGAAGRGARRASRSGSAARSARGACRRRRRTRNERKGGRVVAAHRRPCGRRRLGVPPGGGTRGHVVHRALPFDVARAPRVQRAAERVEIEGERRPLLRHVDVHLRGSGHPKAGEGCRGSLTCSSVRIAMATGARRSANRMGGAKAHATP